MTEYLHVVGTHALYAYETVASVRLDANVTATRDIDLLCDVRKRMSFWTQIERLDSYFLALMKKVDFSFRVWQTQRCMAVNAQGFEVDVFLNTLSFEAVIVDRNGRMAVMRTIQPPVFIEFKRWTVNPSNVKVMPRRQTPCRLCWMKSG